MSEAAQIVKLEQQILNLTARLDALSQEGSSLQAENTAVWTDNTALRAENAALKAENAKLKAQLNQHSGNGSQPPLQDQPWQKTARRSAMPKPTGGQFGHDGRIPKMVTTKAADRVEPLRPGGCACCGEAVAAEGEVIARRQGFEVLDPKLHVTEYQRLIYTCGRCGHQQAAEEACHEHLADTEAHIRARRLASEVNHFDETGLRKRQMYLHVACNALYILLFVYQKRGNEAIGSAPSILPAYWGRAIHDCWATYFMYPVCLHDLRSRAGLMKALLLDLYRRSEQGTTSLPPEEHAAVRKRHEAILERARKEEPPPEPKPPGKKGPPKATQSYNRMLRFDQHESAVLAFAFEEAVPFTHNLAEQALRPAKTKVNVSGGFRTIEGAKRYARTHPRLPRHRPKARTKRLASLLPNPRLLSTAGVVLGSYFRRTLRNAMPEVVWICKTTMPW